MSKIDKNIKVHTTQNYGIGSRLVDKLFCISVNRGLKLSIIRSMANI